MTLNGPLNLKNNYGLHLAVGVTLAVPLLGYIALDQNGENQAHLAFEARKDCFEEVTSYMFDAGIERAIGSNFCSDILVEDSQSYCEARFLRAHLDAKVTVIDTSEINSICTQILN